MLCVLNTLEKWLIHHQRDDMSLVVAFSGGRDSHVLLHALSQLQTRLFSFKLKAVHVNHGLLPQAKAWENHCESICHNEGIPIKVFSLNITIAPGESVEKVAREQRYKALEASLDKNDILLTAHRLEDQAETILLQLMRGAGTLGLAGIAPWKSLVKGTLARPLLDIRRADIADYAQKNALEWIEDPSNANDRFRRNFIRQHIFPILEKQDPGVAKCFARSAKNCAQTQQLLQEYINEDLNQCLAEESSILNIESLKRLTPLKQHHVFRQWLHNNQASMPSSRKLKAIVQQMLNAKEDAQPCVNWGNWEIRRFNGQLYILKSKTNILNACLPSIWHLSSPLTLPDGSTWRATLAKGKGIATSKIPAQSLRLLFRQGGERCQIMGQKFSRPLKKIFQEQQIPSWERVHIPLFYYEQDLVGVGSLFVCEGWQVNSEEEVGWMIEKI